MDEPKNYTDDDVRRAKLCPDRRPEPGHCCAAWCDRDKQHVSLIDCLACKGKP